MPGRVPGVSICVSGEFGVVNPRKKARKKRSKKACLIITPVVLKKACLITITITTSLGREISNLLRVGRILSCVEKPREVQLAV